LYFVSEKGKAESTEFVSIFRVLICSNLLIKLLYFTLIGFLSFEAFAHKVNIFAEADSDVVNVSCYYSKGEKVHAGEIKVLETKNGNLIYRGTTDKNGLLSFKIPEIIIKNNSDIKIILDAGMGHRAEWDMSCREVLESQKTFKENSSLSVEQRRKRNEVKKEKAVERSEISFYRVVLGLTIFFIIFTLAYFLARKKKGNVS